MHKRTVEQIMRVRSAHDAAREILEAASAEARTHFRHRSAPDHAFAPYRKAEAALDAQCQFPGDFSCPMSPDEYEDAIAAMLPAEEYDRQLRERIRAKVKASRMIGEA